MGPLGHSLAALGALLGAPVGAAALALRPAWRPGLSERLGAGVAPPPGAVHVHAASVGEVRAALGLLDALGARGIPLAATTTTLSGRDLLRGLRPTLPVTLAPLDHPWCVEASLRRARPRALAMVETELWPARILRTAARGVPVLVVSGRVSDGSFGRYRRLRAALAPVLRRLAAVGARSALDAERFVALGVPATRVRVTGDLKLEPTARPAPLAGDLDSVLGATPLLVAGSTHPGEEEAALSALAAAGRAGQPLALVLAPRRPARAAELAARVAGHGQRVLLRSRLGGAAPLGPGDVLVLDGIGELTAVYGRARLAFVGGTLAPVGGHNLLEPVQAGVPVLFGPHTANAPEAAAVLLGAGAGLQVADGDALATTVCAWLPDPAELGRRGERGRQALLRHHGTAARSAELVLAALRDVSSDAGDLPSSACAARGPARGRAEG